MTVRRRRSRHAQGGGRGRRTSVSAWPARQTGVIADHHHAHHHPSPEDHRAAVDTALAALRDAGGRVTDGRRAIVTAVLAGDDHHVTADELADALRSEHPGLALSTIYRTLEALEELGIVARVDLGQGRAVYHPIDHAHHHLVCSTCGAVEEIPHDALAPLAQDLASRTGFTLSKQQLTLTGTCKACHP
jgi:Fur family ferric uptake transcriptional regulator